MRRTVAIQSTLFGGLTVLALSACSGAETIDSASVNQELERDTNTHSAGEQARPAHHDPARFLERFDADKNGSVELTELPERMRTKLGKADVDGNGKISIEELKAKIEARRGKKFAKLDSNGDGAISKDEVPEKRWTHLIKADANANGSIDKAELEQALKSGTLGKRDHFRAGKGTHFRRDPAKMVSHFDRDGNGTLELSELPEKLHARLGDADGNKDGKLSNDELKAHFERHRPTEPAPDGNQQ